MNDIMMKLTMPKADSDAKITFEDFQIAHVRKRRMPTEDVGTGLLRETSWTDSLSQ
jgi:hypothetical protein